MNNNPVDLFDFAWFGTQNTTFEDYVRELKEKSLEEDWGDNNKILKNYLSFTFKYSAEQNNKNPELNYIVENFDKSAASFNTGLFDVNYNPIYAFFKKNRVYNRQPWFFIGFKIPSDIEMNSFSTLPKRIQYFINADELIFKPDAEIRINVPHIIEDERNRSRLPASVLSYSDQMIKTLLEGAVELAKKKISANYTLAVPQFYQGQLQLLLPLEITQSGISEMALAVKYENGIYSGRTALTMDMAYNNARLITKPESSWLMSSL